MTVRMRDVFAASPSEAGTVVALRGIDLELPEGSTTALIGPSGSGKSTLLACLAGRRPPLAGRVEAAGIALSGARLGARRRYRRRVVLVRQRYGEALRTEAPVAWSVAMGLRARGIGRREALERARALLASVGLEAEAERPPTALSGGQAQRASLCQALAVAPRLLLADEPTGELDRRSAREVLGALAALAGEHGTTVLLVTHDPLAAAAAERTLVMRDGRITGEVRDGSAFARIAADGLVRLPLELLAESALGDVVRLEPAAGRLALVAEAGTPAAFTAAEPDLPPSERRERVAVALTGVRGRWALRGVDLALEPGAFTALTGPSGSGKTTLLDLVAGLERPVAGSVRVAGAELAGLSRDALAALRRRHVAVVPQSTALSDHLTVRENAELGLLARGRPGAGTERVLAALGLEGLADRPAGELSGGQRQRVALARALAVDPDVLVADEPTANLDERGARDVARLLAQAAARRGTTVLCATHDPAVAAAADAVVDVEGLSAAPANGGGGLRDNGVGDRPAPASPPGEAP